MKEHRIICQGASAVRSSSQRRWSTKLPAEPAPVIRNATLGAGRRGPFIASPPRPVSWRSSPDLASGLNGPAPNLLWMVNLTYIDLIRHHRPG
jgi:hypothetical protein